MRNRHVLPNIALLQYVRARWWDRTRKRVAFRDHTRGERHAQAQRGVRGAREREARAAGDVRRARGRVRVVRSGVSLTVPFCTGSILTQGEHSR
jgi:hypothetical protein